MLAVISDYARSWRLLQGYDEESLNALLNKRGDMRTLLPGDALTAITELKNFRIAKGEAQHCSPNCAVMGWPRR